MAETDVGYRRIGGSERRVARGAQRLAPADPNEKLSVSIRVRRRPGAPPVPDQSYWAAIPPGRRRFTTRDELVAQIGATQADLDKVSEYARNYGFEVVEASAARRIVRVTGTVAQANRAFAVDLGRYQSPEESYRGHEGPVSVPNDVADVIEGVFGLDNRRTARRSGTVVPPGAAQTTPPTAAKDYNFPPLNAAGQTIGILEFGGGFSQNDLNLFCAGLTPPVAPPVVTVLDQNGNPIAPSSPGAPTPPYTGTPANPGADLEVALDVQVVASVAQGACIVMFFADNSTQGWIDSVTAAIYNSPLRLAAITVSWGASEDSSAWDSNTMYQLDLAFAEASYLGITIFSGSGDFEQLG
jgi:kumamolisin